MSLRPAAAAAAYVNSDSIVDIVDTVMRFQLARWWCRSVAEDQPIGEEQQTFMQRAKPKTGERLLFVAKNQCHEL